jgi:glycosyltransferase involved in cell wall biosynthesis
MTRSDPPKVTVFIPVYNREQYIGAAINSILAQTFTNYELLLIDDGSTDRSVELMRSYTDPRVRVVCNESNLGIPRTRNKGLQLARGEYIALLDSDDFAYPERLQKQVAFLDSHPGYAEVGSWSRAMDEQGRPLQKIKRQPVWPEEVQAQLLFRCCLSNRSIMARTAILQEYGYRNDYPRCQDYELHVRLTQRYKLGNLPQVLVLGRVHPEQITRQTTGLGDAKKREIVSVQLTELGVAFTHTDLDPHLTLSRMRKLRFTPNREYLQWAEAWLLKLQEANRQTRRYCERAFTRAVSEKWFIACLRASTGIGWIAWQRFWQSPLSKGSWSSLKQNLLVLAFRRGPGKV